MCTSEVNSLPCPSLSRETVVRSTNCRENESEVARLASDNPSPSAGANSPGPGILAGCTSSGTKGQVDASAPPDSQRGEGRLDDHQDVSRPEKREKTCSHDGIEAAKRVTAGHVKCRGPGRAPLKPLEANSNRPPTRETQPESENPRPASPTHDASHKNEGAIQAGGSTGNKTGDAEHHPQQSRKRRRPSNKPSGAAPLSPPPPPPLPLTPRLERTLSSPLRPQLLLPSTPPAQDREIRRGSTRHSQGEGRADQESPTPDQEEDFEPRRAAAQRGGAEGTALTTGAGAWTIAAAGGRELGEQCPVCRSSLSGLGIHAQQVGAASPAAACAACGRDPVALRPSSP